MLDRTEHLLSCLAEECTEVGQRVSKALRFGLSEVQPGQPLTNAERIVGEIVDLLAVIGMLEECGAIDTPILLRLDNTMMDALDAKKAKVEKFMRYAEEQGALRTASQNGEER